MNGLEVFLRFVRFVQLVVASGAVSPLTASRQRLHGSGGASSCPRPLSPPVKQFIICACVLMARVPCSPFLAPFRQGQEQPPKCPSVGMMVPDRALLLVPFSHQMSELEGTLVLTDPVSSRKSWSLPRFAPETSLLSRTAVMLDSRTSS